MAAPNITYFTGDTKHACKWSVGWHINPMDTKEISRSLPSKNENWWKHIWCWYRIFLCSSSVSNTGEMITKYRVLANDKRNSELRETQRNHLGKRSDAWRSMFVMKHDEIKTIFAWGDTNNICKNRCGFQTTERRPKQSENNSRRQPNTICRRTYCENCWLNSYKNKMK